MGINMTDIDGLRIRQKRKDIIIGVLAGGISSERDISIKTGSNILDSLRRSGYSAVLIDPREEDFIDRIKKISIAFLALHGRYGEDGTVQGLLELLKIPYTGSGVLSSALVMDKILSKKIMSKEGFPTPAFLEVDAGDPLKKIMQIDGEISGGMGYPVVIKPNAEGSTIGISRASGIEELEAGIRLASQYDCKVMIEKYIKGRELTAGVIGMGRRLRVLPVIEIKPISGFFDYESKYTKNLTEYIVPAEIDKAITDRVMDLALRCHLNFGCCGISRTDFILDKENVPYILEINTMPGMTSTSLVPMAAGAAGIDFDRLVEIILDCADLKIY
jgi:D-alanine-D-alanine ligase